MRSDHLEIPRYGGAGVSFLGVEFKDAWLLVGCTVAGLLLGHVHVLLYFVLPGAGYLLNRAYVEWLSSGPPGRLRSWAYELGLAGYSAGHRSPDVVFIGDARGVFPGWADVLDLAGRDQGRAHGAAATRAFLDDVGTAGGNSLGGQPVESASAADPLLDELLSQALHGVPAWLQQAGVSAAGSDMESVHGT